MKIVIDQKQEVARRSVENIRNIAETMGERNTGSEGEKRTADFYTSRLENACDFVKTESFDVYPDAYTGWTYIVGTLSILALVSYFFSVMVSVLLVAIALTVYIVQFVLGKRFLDPLYKKEKSQNVTAIKKKSERSQMQSVFRLVRGRNERMDSHKTFGRNYAHGRFVRCFRRSRIPNCN